MRRILKWVGIVVVVLLLCIGGFVGFVAMSGLPTYEYRKIDLVVDKSPERIARGRHLATHLCAGCHRNPETGRLSGYQMLDMPEMFGTAYSKNITNHKTMGIGAWSDGDIAWLLRTGIHPHTGNYVPPWMPKLIHMSDDDLHSVIAFLRSDDDLVAPVNEHFTPSKPSLFAKLLVRTVFSPFDYPTKPIPHPDTTKTVVYGNYLATAVYDCYGCHSADFATIDPVYPEKSEGFLGGGMEMPDASKQITRPANITPDKAHGIGNYTREEFINTMKTGHRKDGTTLRYPMMSLSHLSDHALGSIYDYLRTAPPLPTEVVRFKPVGPWKTKGAELFDRNGCTSCHGFDGKGIASLLKADAKYPEDSILVDVIKHQRVYNPDSYMPLFEGYINDGDLAVLASHVRGLCKKH